MMPTMLSIGYNQIFAWFDSGCNQLILIRCKENSQSLGIDAENIVIAGGSAGANVASFASTLGRDLTLANCNLGCSTFSDRA